MRELFVSGVVFGTVLTAMAFGVMLGYTAILGILWLFGHRNRIQRPAPAPVLAAQAHTSGD
jgi:hypothetical protein